MLSTSELERALAAAGLHAPVRFEEVTGSTNATALELAEAGAPEWTLVATNHQTAGRGRQGRTWVDRPADALLFSLLLRPTWLEPEAGGLLPLLAGAAMATSLVDVAGVEARCKWPNDLLVAGAKVGGILVESAVGRGRLPHAVVGVGVNLEVPPDVANAAGVGAADPTSLLIAFLRSFHDGYSTGAPGFADVVRDRWRAISVTLGRDVEATGTDGTVVRGRAIDIDRRGALVVGTADGDARVTSGEVRHLTQG